MIKRRANALVATLRLKLPRVRVGGVLNTTISYTNVLKYTYILAYLVMFSGFLFNLVESQTYFKVQFGRLMSWEAFLLDHIAGMSLYTFSLVGLMGFANKIYEIRSVGIRFAIFFVVVMTWFFLFIHFDPRF